MKFISAYTAERNIAKLLAEPDTHTPAAQKALEGLQNSGSGAIPIMIDAFASADANQTTSIVKALSSSINNRNFNEAAKGLCHPNDRCATGIVRALSASDNYSCEKLLQILDMEELGMHYLMDVVQAHLDEIDIKQLLQVAYKVEPNMKKTMFKMIEAKATQDMVPDLIARTGGRDHAARVHIIQILSKFSKPEVQHAMEELLKDQNRQIRVAALEAMSKLRTEQNLELIANMLLDSDLEVQSKAADLLIQLNNPKACKYLVDVLKDDSEYTRRSAVEVLNGIADEDSVKYLLGILGDNDWWVRSRACDALGNIGGDSVIAAVMKLVSDEDDNVRRSAIEILNYTNDERAIKYLLKATQDKDWWVVERAVDALGGMGNQVAIPRLEDMLEGNAKTIPAVIRAIGKIGDDKLTPKIMSLLQRSEPSIVSEALTTLAEIATEKNALELRAAVASMIQNPNENIAMAAGKALDKFDIRFSDEVLAQDEKAAKLSDGSHTVLMDASEVERIAAQMAQEAESTAVLGTDASPIDVAALVPGEVIEDRYKFIQKIGKGAFGTVILVEDTVVDEQLILKFLNPDVSADEEMLKRFVHELRFSRKITHKNVIRIYDFLKLAGAYAISMEFFESHTLGQEIPDKQPMPFDKAAGWAMDIATGMAVAHEVGIIHRDLKPANLLINDDGLLKIVDFGVAAAAGAGNSELTKTGYVIGSPKYMAPEQILGKKVDHRADIYSLGVIFYEMLTGVPPYTKGDQMAVMYQHVQGKCVPCDEANPNIPPALATIVKKAMDLDKDNRFESMEAFRDAIEQAQAGQE
jgi:HEAT repeat protein